MARIGLLRLPRTGKMESEVHMLSRGKLVHDWSRRLAAAEDAAAEAPPQSWLFQMRVRLYRFLLSCYRQGDWRADERSISAGETWADVPHGETTTILDCPLDGKPAKTTGKMQAVLKSVSAAQDHPAQAGPLLDGIAADEWVVAVSVRDKLRMASCQELLRHFGIASKWTMQGEIKVRLFDMDRATQLVRTYRDSLKVKRRPESAAALPVQLVESTYGWAPRLVLMMFLLAPAYSVAGLMFTQCFLIAFKQPPIAGPDVAIWLAIWYFASLQLLLLATILRGVFQRRKDLEDARRLAERSRETSGGGTSPS